MVIDCFMFYDEHDLLDLKLRTEYPAVDKFVIVESTCTHQGKPKPLYFDLNKFPPEFHDKIEHIVVDEVADNSWNNVKLQRDSALQALKDCKDDDIILITDVDEIVNPEALNNYHRFKGAMCLEMNLYYYYFNCKCTGKWNQAIIAPYSVVKSHGSLMDIRENLNGNLYVNDKILHNAGWHFSYLGGTEKIIKKLESFYHDEYNTDYFKNPEHIEQVLNEGRDLFDRDHIKFEFVNIDGSYPQYIVDNQEMYRNLGFIKRTGPKYSLIIPTYGHFEDSFRPCVESILQYTDFSDKELIVVANGCGDDGTIEYVDSLKTAKLLWFDNPIGYTGAANEGIAAATGEYVILLNNDVVLIPQPVDEWIRRLHQPFIEDVKVGITGPNQLYSPQTKRWFILFYCAMIKRQLFDEIGLLDEVFSPGFGEDIDFCFRTEKAGYKLVHVDPKSVPNHEKKVMAGGDFPLLHTAGVTIKEVPDISEIIKRNEQILVDKYDKPKVSIVIPTYNHCEDLLQPCIDSIIQYTDLSDKEVIIVANGCTDSTKVYVEHFLGTAFKVVWSDAPLGYTKAANEGIKASKGEYVVLLNNDTILLKQSRDKWINMLLDPFHKFPNMGITGPLMSYFPAADRGFLIFCCVMIKRKLFDELGLLDEIFSPGFGEDTDFCFKAMDAGYSIMRVPEQNSIMNPPDPNPENEFMVGDFPFYHKGEGTLNDIPDVREIIRRNALILESRYKKGEVVVEESIPKISVIIPTYNHLEDCLKPCLESIKKHTHLDNVEIIVVANGCKDGTRDYVESLGKPFKLLWFDEAIGYTKATNEGIKVAKGEYVVLLNNDTEIIDLSPNQPKNLWIDMLLGPLESDSSIGMTGPMKVNDKYIKRDFLIFFCVMTRRKFFDEFGLLDEIFSPGFGEDVDFCMRLVKAGYKLVQVPVKEGHSWEETVMVGGFPIFHAGEQTLNDGKMDFSNIIKRNSEILKERYNISSQKMSRKASTWYPYPLTEEQRNIRGLKLNLGCSIIYLNDFINIDINNPIADIEADVKHLPMFKDNTVSLILNTHLIEHFNKDDAIIALKEWHRVLKPGGWLVTEAPDVDKCMRIYLDDPDPAKKYQGLCGVFGMNWVSIYMAHLWGYTEQSLGNILRNIGFTYIVPGEPSQHQGRVHNFRLDARK